MTGNRPRYVRAGVAAAVALALVVVAAPAPAWANEVEEARLPAASVAGAMTADGASTFLITAYAKFTDPVNLPEAQILLSGPGRVTESENVRFPAGFTEYGKTWAGECTGTGIVSVYVHWQDSSMGMAQKDSEIKTFACRNESAMLWGKPWSTRGGQALALGGVAVGIAVAILSIPAGPWTGGAAWVFGLSVFGAALSGAQVAIADPPDPDFATLVRAAPYPVPTVSTDDGLTPAAVTVLTRLMTAQARVTEQELALAKTLNKWQGAVVAGDTEWQDRQAASARGFADALAPLLRAMADLQDTVSADLTAAGMSDVPFSADDVASGALRWFAEGPTPATAAQLAQQGWNDPLPGYPDETTLSLSRIMALQSGGASPSSLFQILGTGAGAARQFADELDAWGPPLLTSVTPATGPEAGGTRVTVQGSRLDTVNEVRFGSVPGSQLSCTATTCQVTTPPGAGANDVVAVTPGGASATTLARFTYLPAPGTLLANGSFEGGGGFPATSSFTVVPAGQYGAWQVSGHPIDVVGPEQATAASGRQFVDLNGNDDASPGPATMSQSVPTVAGNRYTLGFAMAGNPNGGPTVKRLRASLGDTGETFTFDTTGISNEDLGWQSHTLSAVACGASLSVTLTSLTAGIRGPNVDSVTLSDDGPAGAGACRGVPGAPTSLRAKVRHGAIKARWVAPSATAVTGYVVQISKKNRKHFRTRGVLPASTTKFVWRKGTKGTRYHLRVAATATAGQGRFTRPVKVRIPR